MLFKHIITNLKMSKVSPKKIYIKELNLDLLQPNTKTYMDTNQGGSKHVVIGKPGTGKSTLIAALLYAKRHIYPAGIVFSGTEDSNGFYKRMFPNTFIFTKYDEDQLRSFIKRQKIAKKHVVLKKAKLKSKSMFK